MDNLIIGILYGLCGYEGLCQDFDIIMQNYITVQCSYIISGQEGFYCYIHYATAGYIHHNSQIILKAKSFKDLANFS